MPTEQRNEMLATRNRSEICNDKTWRNMCTGQKIGDRVSAHVYALSDMQVFDSLRPSTLASREEIKQGRSKYVRLELLGHQVHSAVRVQVRQRRGPLLLTHER